jgi:methyl-CpG-binding domain protein 4
MQTKKFLSDFFELCPDAETCMQVPREQIQELIRSLGLHAKRSRMLQRLSQEYLAETWTYVTDLHSVGRYVLFY